MLEFPHLQFAHGEEIDILRETVRRFAEDEIAPRATEIDEKNEFPADLWRKMGDLGILGITVSEEYGGADMGLSGALYCHGGNFPRFCVRWV